jgi:hypothetical protein
MSGPGSKGVLDSVAVGLMVKLGVGVNEIKAV